MEYFKNLVKIEGEMRLLLDISILPSLAQSKSNKPSFRPTFSLSFTHAHTITTNTSLQLSNARSLSSS